jgi:HEAT repeat protein
MNPPAPELLPPDTAAALIDFARGCKAAVRAVSLYPGQHPAISASLTRLVQATGRLTATGPLQLHVRPDQLLIGTAMLPKPDQGVRELAELLHRHLIGALTVNAGADADSWRTLLLLLARAPEEVRADGGIAHLWATAGGPSVEIRQVDYAEVLREKKGEEASIDEIIAAALAGTPIPLDDEDLDAMLALLADPEKVAVLMARLDAVAKEHGADAKVAAIMNLVRGVIDVAKKDPQKLEQALKHLGHLAAHLSPGEMLQLISQRNAGGADADIAGGVLQRMDDKDVAQFVARSIVKERGASGRLAHAFQALVPDAGRQQHLMGLAQEEVAQSELGQEASFGELWQRVETMVTSYSDKNFVSAGYARELSAAQTKPVEVEQTSDDPPERIGAWLATVSDGNLRALDHQLLRDLLMIEQDPARWRDVADTAAAHAEDLVRVGYFDQAWQLADQVIAESGRIPGRATYVQEVLERFGRGGMMKHVAAYLRSADDAAFERFQRLCHAIGTPVIAPLAETLATEQDARSRRRLRDVLIAFGAKGRDVVQQLMNAPNWEVRRTAAFLLREFGGSEGLRELIPLLTDSEPLVQREAVQGIVFNGTPEAAAILVNALHAASARTRQTLVNELTSIRDPKAAPLFSQVVKNLNRQKLPQVYLAAIEALGTFADPAAVEALKTALHRGEWWAPLRTRRERAAAATSLRKIGTPQALDVLRSAASTGSRGTRNAAKAELAHL